MTPLIKSIAFYGECTPKNSSRRIERDEVRPVALNVLSKNMGAWGTRSFENDQAMDWLDGFRDDPSEGFITATLSDPCDSADSDPEGVVAAGEMVAFLCGFPPEVPHEELEGLPRISISPSIRSDAARALDRVMNSSWLRGSWEETELLDVWIAEITDLQRRLTQQ